LRLEVKALAPTGCDHRIIPSAFHDAARGGLTVVDAAECVASECLAAALAERGKKPLWLRLGPEDADPGVALASLVAVAERCRAGAGQVTLSWMRARPGPVYGWPPLFGVLADALADCVAGHGAVVIEDAPGMLAAGDTLSLIGTYVLAPLARVAPCVLVSGHRLPPAAFGDRVPRRVRDPRTPAAAAERVLRRSAPALSGRSYARVASVAGGRPAVLAALLSLPDETDGGVRSLLGRPTDWEDILTRVASVLLGEAAAGQRRALGIALATEYYHPAMATAVPGASGIPAGPWLQTLQDGWVRVPPCWQRALRAVLGSDASPPAQALSRAAGLLLRAGDEARAISLQLALGEYEAAARAIAYRAGDLVELGLWSTVEGWLSQLPADVLTAHPDLLYYRADIAADRGDMRRAERWFGAAAEAFAKQGDVGAECHSMLAGSNAAASAGDLATARHGAAAAGALAEIAGLADAQMWAAWQQGRLALAAGDFESALDRFARAAADSAPDDVTAGPVRTAARLTTLVAQLRQERKAHLDAEAGLRGAEEEAWRELQAQAGLANGRADLLAGRSSGAPTLAPLDLPDPATAVPGHGGFLGRLLGLPRHGAAGRHAAQRDWRRRDDSRQHKALPGRPHPDGPPASIRPGGGPADTGAGAGRQGYGTGHASVACPPRDAGVIPGQKAAAAWETPARVLLAVHLLGPLQVTANDVPVEDWSSGRYRSLFGYLVTHRQPWPKRDVLMDVFWPESEPRASRNSLNVTMHGLRRLLRTASDATVIEYTAGLYRLHPDVRLWLDTDEFETRVSHARRLDDEGDASRATDEYEVAAALYQGDFLEEDPYEEWAAPIRERLRLTYLDALGKLARLHFTAGRYAACAGLCQRIIGLDPCREDAHRRLMRCYSRQGQRHLALLQYRACARALASDLGVGPDRATTELQARIRRNEPV
jgi:DNA-binding SARP family transcriptional activator